MESSGVQMLVSDAADTLPLDPHGAYEVVSASIPRGDGASLSDRMELLKEEVWKQCLSEMDLVVSESGLDEVGLVGGVSPLWLRRLPVFFGLYGPAVQAASMRQLMTEFGATSVVVDASLPSDWRLFCEVLPECEVVESRERRGVFRRLVRGVARRLNVTSRSESSRRESHGVRSLRTAEGARRLVALAARGTDVAFASVSSGFQHLGSDGGGGGMHGDVILGDVPEIVEAAGHMVTLLSSPNESASAEREYRLRRDDERLVFTDGCLARTDPSYPHARSIDREFARRLRASRRSRCAVSGVDLGDHLERILRSQASASVQAAGAASGHRELLERIRPRVLVLVSENSTNGPMLAAARQLGIPTVGIQHGQIYDGHPAYCYSTSVDRDRIPRCDRMLVWGEASRDVLTGETGCYSPSQVRVTGAVRTRRDSASAGVVAAVRRDLGVDSSTPVALFTPSPTGHDTLRRIVESWIEVAPPYFLVVKTHPRDSAAAHEFQAMLDAAGTVSGRVLTDYDLHGLISVCDVHLSVTSTTIAEAALLLKPSIAFAEPRIIDTMKYAEAGVAIAAGRPTPESLKDALTRLQDPAVRKRMTEACRIYSVRQYGDVDGRSSQRIADEILEMIEG